MARLRAIVKAIYNASIINCCNSPGNFAAYVVSLLLAIVTMALLTSALILPFAWLLHLARE
jgi:ABC-type sulfate transport system permease component